MKKAILLATLVLLTGCSTISSFFTEEETTQEAGPTETTDTTSQTLTCTQTDETVLFHAKGDRLMDMTQTFYLNFEDLGVTSDMDADAIQERINTTLG